MSYSPRGRRMSIRYPLGQRRVRAYTGNRTDNQKKHAMMRFQQRFGVFLTDQTYMELTRKIRHGSGERIRNAGTGNGRTLWKIQALGKDILAVYDKESRMIVTFLPISFLPSYVDIEV